MESINNILTKLLVGSPNWQVQLLQNWDRIIGSLKTHVCLEKIEDTTIIIGVYEAHWMQELFLMSNMIVKHINSALETGKISKVKFKLIQEKKINHVKKFKTFTAVDIQPKNFNLNAVGRTALDKINDERLKEYLLGYYNRINA